MGNHNLYLCIVLCGLPWCVFFLLFWTCKYQHNEHKWPNETTDGEIEIVLIHCIVLILKIVSIILILKSYKFIADVILGGKINIDSNFNLLSSDIVKYESNTFFRNLSDSL